MKLILNAITVCLIATSAFADREIDVTKAADLDGRVSVEVRSGKIRVHGWDRAEIRVVGRLGERVKELEFDAKGSRTKIVVHRHLDGRRTAVDLDIYVPAGSEMDIETVSASIRIENMGSEDIDAQSVSGSIEIDHCKGAIAAESVSGTVSIAHAVEEVTVETTSGGISVAGHPTNVEAKTVSGSVEIDGVTESVDAKSISGGIRIAGDMLEECAAKTVSGSIGYAGGLAEDGEIDFHSMSGSVDVRLRHPVDGEYKLSSFSGRIQLNLGEGVQLTGGRGPGSRLKFEYGDGDAEITVKSFSGSITIEVE